MLSSDSQSDVIEEALVFVPVTRVLFAGLVPITVGDGINVDDKDYKVKSVETADKVQTVVQIELEPEQ